MASPAFGSVPFKQQIAFFAQKANVTTEGWTDVYAQQHDSAFAVAGANRDAIVSDFRAAVGKAISENATLEDFRKDFDAIVERYGWDYTGGRNWRSRVIYETNLRQSYNAGRYEQQRANPVLKYWRYRHSDSVRNPRPEHEAWDGKIWPADDPIWNTLYPANGWGCQCYVEALSAGDLKRMNLSVDTPPKLEYQDVIIGQRSAAGSRTVHVPVGVDPGFEYAPGSSRPSGPGPSTPSRPKKPRTPKPKAPQPEAKPAPAPKPALSHDELIAAGRKAMDGVLERLPLASSSSAEIQQGVRDLVSATVQTGHVPKVNGSKEVARLLARSASLLPKSWAEVSDAYPLTAKVATSRAWSWTASQDYPAIVSGQIAKEFGVLRNVAKGDGYMLAAKNDIAVTLHEFVHRVQSLRPDIDAQFQEFHRRRTAGDELKSLRSLTGNLNYGIDEVAREDHYFTPYVGREYGSLGALEVMTMAIEAVLGGPVRFNQIMTLDRELADFTLGMLLHVK